MNDQGHHGILSTVKEALLNLLVFLLVFVLVATLFLAYYGIALLLVPGGKGLVFSNPFAAALIPALLGGLVAAQYRSVHRPGRFVVTWSLQAGAFFLLLTLPLPYLQQMPPVRASDDTPLLPLRFLPMEDGSMILSPQPPTTILVPSDGGLMTVSPVTQFDPLNQRFVFSSTAPRALGSTGPEREYFQYTKALVSFQTDLLALYTVLRDNLLQHPFVFWFQAAVVTWLFLGVYFFFSLKTWPLVQIVLVLIVVRLCLLFLVYAFWSLPALIDLWIPAPGTGWVRTWGPIGFVGVAAASLFFMTLLSKPHRQVALG